MLNIATFWLLCSSFQNRGDGNSLSTQTPHQKKTWLLGYCVGVDVADIFLFWIINQGCWSILIFHCKFLCIWFEFFLNYILYKDIGTTLNHSSLSQSNQLIKCKIFVKLWLNAKHLSYQSILYQNHPNTGKRL